MRIVSLTYVNSFQFTNPIDWIGRLYAFTGVLEELSKDHNVFSIEQINFTGDLTHKGVHYYFRNYGSQVTRWPFALHGLVRQLKADVILVRGLNFPLQVIQLRYAVGPVPRIIVENHFDHPPVGLRRMAQKMAYHRINAYHFISLGDAEEWIRAGIIRDRKKIVEIPAGSARVSPEEKEVARQRLNLSGNRNFLWVGSLSARKDPITVINAFEKYILQRPDSRLYMIHQSDELLPEIIERCKRNPGLKNAITLLGRLPNEALGTWYSGADYFIMGTHAEGGSIAMLEALACGCIPVVTAIPSSLATTLNGRYGFHFAPGDHEELHKQLLKLDQIDAPRFSAEIKEYFKKELSFEAIAKKFVKATI